MSHRFDKSNKCVRCGLDEPEVLIKRAACQIHEVVEITPCRFACAYCWEDKSILQQKWCPMTFKKTSHYLNPDLTCKHCGMSFEAIVRSGCTHCDGLKAHNFAIFNGKEICKYCFLEIDKCGGVCSWLMKDSDHVISDDGTKCQCCWSGLGFLVRSKIVKCVAREEARKFPEGQSSPLPDDVAQKIDRLGARIVAAELRKIFKAYYAMSYEEQRLVESIVQEVPPHADLDRWLREKLK